MPRVPKIDELQIGVKGAPQGNFAAGQARHMEAAQVSDLSSRARAQSIPNNQRIGGRPLQAVQFSDVDARQQIAMGQAISEWADVFREIGIRQADEMDRARVFEAQTAYEAQALEAANNPETGWKAQRGKAALPDDEGKTTLESRTFDRINPAKEKILESLGNERQRQAFMDYVAEREQQQREAISAHVLKESMQYRVDVYEGGIALGGKQVATGGISDIQSGLARINEQIAGIAQLQGLPPDKIEALRQQYASPYVAAAIGKRLDAGDIHGAQQLLADLGDYMDAKDTVQTMAAYKAAWETQQIIMQADMDFSGADVAFTPAEPGDVYAVYNQGFNDAKYRQKAFGVESGNNDHAKNPESSAYGRAQALSGTWMAFGNSEVGRQLRGGMSKAEWLEMRTDPAVANAFMDWYRDESIAHFRQKGVPVNDTTMYLAHFLGWVGAAKVYQAPPGTDNGKVIDNYYGKSGKKGVYEANKRVMDANPTTDKLIAWAAGKMGVKPDGELATGRPQPTERMSNAQLKQRAQQLWPDNQQKQQLYVSRYGTKRDVEIEQEAAVYNGHLNEALDVVYSGGGVENISPQSWAALSPEDKNKILRQRESTYDLEQKILERENLDLFLRISDARKVEKMTEDQILAARLDLGDQYAKKLLEKKRALEKAKIDSSRQMTLEDAVRKNLIFELGVINPWDLKKPEDKQAMAYAELNIQDSINHHVIQYALAGEELTREKLIELVRADVGAKVIQYRDNWMGKRVGDEKHAIFQPPTHGLYLDRNKLGMWRID